MVYKPYSNESDHISEFKLNHNWRIDFCLSILFISIIQLHLEHLFRATTAYENVIEENVSFRQRVNIPQSLIFVQLDLLNFSFSNYTISNNTIVEALKQTVSIHINEDKPTN